MNKVLLKSATAILVPLLINLSTPEDIFGANEVVTPPKTECFIEVGNAHISTSILEQQGRPAVKVNATSRCNFPQSSVILTVKIFKEGFGAPHLVAQRSTKAKNSKSNGLVVKNQFTFAYCKNLTKSRYYGVAFAQATIRGKRYATPPTWSEKTIELGCGT